MIHGFLQIMKFTRTKTCFACNCFSVNDFIGSWALRHWHMEDINQLVFFLNFCLWTHSLIHFRIYTNKYLGTYDPAHTAYGAVDEKPINVSAIHDSFFSHWKFPINFIQTIENTLNNRQGKGQGAEREKSFSTFQFLQMCFSFNSSFLSREQP